MSGFALGAGVALGSGSLTIGATAISGGTSGRVLYDNAGVVGELTTTGTAGTAVVLATSPVLVTPTLGAATSTSVSSTSFQAIYTGTAIPAGGTTGAGYRVSSTANFGLFFGSGAPTLSAAKGSLYMRSDGTDTNDRMYVNTNGGTTWTAVVTVA